MKLLRRTLLLPLIFSLFIPVLAQDKTRTIEQMKETAKGFKNHRQFKLSYDKFKDLSFIDVGPFRTSGLSLSAIVDFKSTVLNEPIKEVTLRFESVSPDWLFLRNHDLYIMADGERLEVGKSDHDGTVNIGSVSEVVYVDVPYSSFSKIVVAKVVEMKLGNHEMKLKDEHLQAFRDLDSLIKP